MKLTDENLDYPDHRPPKPDPRMEEIVQWRGHYVTRRSAGKLAQLGGRDNRAFRAAYALPRVEGEVKSEDVLSLERARELGLDKPLIYLGAQAACSPAAPRLFCQLEIGCCRPRSGNAICVACRRRDLEQVGDCRTAASLLSRSGPGSLSASRSGTGPMSRPVSRRV